MKNLWVSGPKDQDCNKHGIIIVYNFFFEDYSLVRCRGCNKHTYSVGKLREVVQFQRYMETLYFVWLARDVLVFSFYPIISGMLRRRSFSDKRCAFSFSFIESKRSLYCLHS